MKPARFGGVSALLFVALVVPANVLLIASGFPDGSTARVEEAVAAVANRPALVAASLGIGPIAWVAMICFGAGAYVRFRKDGDQTWAAVGLLGTVFLDALFGAVTAARIAFYAAARDGDGPAVNTLWHLQNGAFAINIVAIATVMIGFSISGRQAGVLPAWHPYLGFTAATLLLIGAVLAPLAADGVAVAGLVGLVGFVLWLVWLAAIGVILLRPRSA